MEHAFMQVVEAADFTVQMTMEQHGPIDFSMSTIFPTTIYWLTGAMYTLQPITAFQFLQIMVSPGISAIPVFPGAQTAYLKIAQSYF